jgi:hypothetical protein
VAVSESVGTDGFPFVLVLEEQHFSFGPLSGNIFGGQQVKEAEHHHHGNQDFEISPQMACFVSVTKAKVLCSPHIRLSRFGTHNWANLSLIPC